MKLRDFIERLEELREGGYNDDLDVVIREDNCDGGHWIDEVDDAYVNRDFDEPEHTRIEITIKY